MTYLRTGLSLTATLALSVSTLPSAFAQEGPGLTGTLSFSQGFEVSDNEDLDSSTSGTTFTSRTGIGFGVESETRVETLRLNIGTELVGETGGGASDEFDVENTSARMVYNRRGANSRLSFSARYIEYQLDDDVIDLGPSFGIGFGSGTIVIDDGSATITGLNALVETGIEGPFGLELRAGYLNREYTNTIDPDLTDSETVSLDALARFRLNPALSTRVRAGISVEDEEDASSTETEETYVGVGLEGQTAGGLSFTGDLLFDRTETTVIGPSTRTDDGIGIEVGIVQDRPTGTIGFDVSSRIDDEGRRTAVSVNRTIDLQNGEFGFSLGVVDQEGDDSLRPRGTLVYRQDTPRGGLTASLAREVDADDGDVTASTRIAVDFTQDINATSGWSAGIAYTAVDEVNGADDDDRASARLAYRRALTEDWRMNTGVEHVRESIAGDSTETSNTIFFNIERDVTFGF